MSIMKKQTKVSLFLLLLVLVIGFALGHIPVEMVCPFLDDTSAISAVQLEFDTGRHSTWYSLSDPAQIDVLCSFFEDVHLRLSEPFFHGIKYGDSSGENNVRLIGISFGNAKNHIFLKNDGSIYTSSYGYKANGSNISELYQYLMNTYYALAE